MSIKASFNDTPTSRGKSRIMYDVNNIRSNKHNLNQQEGIYFKFNIDNYLSTKYKMLLVGPEDSPYTNGFYLFEGQFPDQYPYRPMSMKSITQGGNIRKHPNLYRCGKCCFSFLGTWTGPPWTACQNPTTVAISMRSVLTNNPITNEPGWEKKNDANTKLYENLIRYFNIKYGVINIVKNMPYLYLDFKDDIYKCFLENYETYKKEIDKFRHLDKQNVKSPVYSFNVNVNCSELDNELDTLYSNLSKNNNSSKIIIAKPSKRKCPQKPASFYDENTIMDGLDSRKWIVKVYSNGSKRWVLKK